MATFKLSSGLIQLCSVKNDFDFYGKKGNFIIYSTEKNDFQKSNAVLFIY